MNVSQFDLAKTKPAHSGTVHAMPALPDGVQAPFRHAWVYLKPHSALEGHAHPTEEVFFFHRGQGTMTVGSEERPIASGEWVEIPPNAHHSVRNDSDSEIIWIALWWSVQK